MCFLAEYVWQQTSFSTWITTKQLYRLDCFFACKCSLALLYLSMQVWYRGPSILLCGWFFVPHLIPRPPTVSSYLCLANSNKLFLSGSIGCQEMEDIQIDVISALFWQLYPSFLYSRKLSNFGETFWSELGISEEKGMQWANSQREVCQAKQELSLLAYSPSKQKNLILFLA